MKLKFFCFAAILLLSGFSISCSGDDDKAIPCPVTETYFSVDGELKTFSNSGTGLDMIWGTNGHELTLDFTETGGGKHLILKIRYKKTGHNVIDELLMSQYSNGPYMNYNLVNEDFECHVQINRPSCFYATFSGSYIEGGEKKYITNGVISVEYDEPFDQK